MNQVRAAPRTAVHPLRAAPDVSVCVANWNCVALLRRCLRSLYEQPQGAAFEVIVADNGSTDGAADMVAAEFPQVVLIRNADNRGFARASNQAAAVARGRYLFFLNNDTVVPPYTIGRLLELSEENPGVGMIGPLLRGTDGCPQISYRRRPTLAALLHRISFLRWTGLFRRAYYEYRRATFDPSGRRSVEALMGAAVFLPREVFESSGCWDEGSDFGVEDIDLSTQVVRRRPLLFTSEVEVVHHGRAAGRSNISFAAPNVAIGYVRYFRKAGASRWALRVYKVAVTLDAPLHIGLKLFEAGCRLITGRVTKARKSLSTARGLWAFLRHELLRFWKA